MDVTIRSYIKKISRKNLIFPGIVLVISVLLLLFAPFDQFFDPPKATSLDEIIQLQKSGSRYVDFTLKDLHYTTYDYYTGRGDDASCYYYILDEKENPVCVFFLIPAEHTNNRAEVLDTYSAKAKFVSGGNRFDTFLSGFATDIGWNRDDLAAVSGGFAVSEYDYKPGLATAVQVLLFLVALASLIYFLANLLIIFVPHLHPSCRRLKHFGLDGKDFTEIDKELAENLLICAGRIFVTENYLIVLGKRTLWMVPLFNIVWAYKFSNWNPLVKKNKLTYSLVIITSPKAKIAIRGNRKTHTDEILAFLDENFSHITVGYSDEIREKMEELL